jgi:uncharacterized caspase-like protein
MTLPRDSRFYLKPKYDTSRALIIGIDKYKSAAPLSYAVSDAEAIREVLVDRFNFLQENIIYLENAGATRANISKSFLSLCGDRCELDDRIVVFFAGHGMTTAGSRGDVGFLVPHDADLKDYSTLVRWDEFTRNADLIKAKHILFIMDCCYSGLALTRQLQPGSTRFLRDMLRRFSRQVITAGKADEVVADSGGPIPNHSVFTGHLIEGLLGGAATDQGVITGNSLMAYVYQKVATDKNSSQTPHFGQIEGDGDIIILAPSLFTEPLSDKKEDDQLVEVPFVEEAHTRDSIQAKVTRIKRLLAANSSTIELHDFMIEEVKRFLSESSQDHFRVQGPFSTEEFLDRISKYEAAVSDLCILIACVSYWAAPQHRQILQKTLARSADRVEGQSGLTVWLSLRWYPILLEIYCGGIAAIEGQRYDSLANIFLTKVNAFEYSTKHETLAEVVTQGMLDLNRMNVFKQIPGHENQYTPLSEYLFKLLQPRLDDALFVGRTYEASFDEFEVFFALVIADSHKQTRDYVWGPVGRFGWKESGNENGPLARVVRSARKEGADWPPLRAGLFGGDPARFLAVAEEYVGIVKKLGWW